MWPLVTDSNYFKAVSTVMNQTHFQVAMFAFNTVLLYDDYYYIIQGINKCSTWFKILGYQLVLNVIIDIEIS